MGFKFVLMVIGFKFGFMVIGFEFGIYISACICELKKNTTQLHHLNLYRNWDDIAGNKKAMIADENNLSNLGQRLCSSAKARTLCRKRTRALGWGGGRIGGVFFFR